MKRYNPDLNIGLTNEEISKRIEENLVHKDVSVKTKSIKDIIRTNFFTLFNFLNFGLALAILLVGAYKNLLFMGTVLANMFISIFQEIRAKKIVDRLSLISETKVTVIRNGKRNDISKDEIVLDDLTILRLGNQVVVDSIVMSGSCLVNESFITGEEKPIEKKNGDMILSGSFIVSGTVVAKVEHIGEENYTSIISKDAKYLKKVNSELMDSLNKVIKYLSFSILPIGLLLFLNQLGIEGNSFETAVVNTAAGLIGMIPDGLVLLTSTVLVVSVMKLSKYNVLVQELYCIETLARVDVLCLDKTGTITEGVMEVKDIIVENGFTKEYVYELMNLLCHTFDDISPTMNAVRSEFEKEFNFTQTTKSSPSKTHLHADKVNSFSSDRKYSSAVFGGVTYYLGAPEFIVENPFENVPDLSDYRILLLAKEENGQKEKIAFILIQDKVRREAKKTLKFFKEQGVDIRIISGDNPITVSKIAKRVGISNYKSYIDLSKLDNLGEIKKDLSKYAIFGRVRPEQKKELVKMFKRLGHTVAMTGDGVNDVLALKEADCSIAMASGSDAARNVSQLVLLDSNFDSLPRVVREGRKTINNIGRSASLFLVKTIYTVMLVATLLFTSYNYPFKPIHLSLMNLITIGAPAFVLALESNNERVNGSFLSNVVANALPTSLTIFVVLLSFLSLGTKVGLTIDEKSTIAVILTTIIMLIYQFKLCVPFNKLRILLFSTMCSIFAIELIFFKNFFSLSYLTETAVFILIIFIILALLLWKFFTYMFDYVKYNYRKYKIKRTI